MLKLAWRNIWRNRRRTVLTLLAIAFASAVLIFFISIQLSSYSASINATVAVFQGHLQVQQPGYQDDPEIRDSISDALSIRDAIARVDGVAGVSVRANGFAMTSSEERSYGTQIVGVQVQHEPGVSTIPGLVRSGSYLSSDTALEAVLGKTLAENLKISVGEELTLLGQGADGSLAATVLTLVGIFESGSVELDRSIVEIPLKTFKDTFQLNGDGHAIVIQVKSAEDLEQVTRELTRVVHELNPELSVLDWDELAPGLRQAIEFDMAFGWLFFSSLIIIVTFSVLNTVVMSLMERTREFGVMLALGTTPRRLTSMILIETAILLSTGALLGILIGSAVVSYYGSVGFYIPGTEEVMKLWNLPAAIHPRNSLLRLTLGPGVISVITMLMVLLPALRLRQLKPVEALRAT